MTAEGKSWKTRWAKAAKPASDAETTSTAAATEPLGACMLSSLPALPQIKRLRVCLLGNNAGVPGVLKPDVASAVLRGLTADWPGIVDPVFDFENVNGAFEKAWTHMLDEPPPEARVKYDKWGMGPVLNWSMQKQNKDRLQFDKNPVTPPWEASPAEDFCSVFPGGADKLNLGQEQASASCKAFREAVSKAGHDLGSFEKVHADLYKLAQGRPRELVWLSKPCPGLSASFARFSPEAASIGDLQGCGAVILDIFDEDKRPLESSKNVGMLYAAVPDGKVHKNLSGGKLLHALQGAASNIARLMREYNWVASGTKAGDLEHGSWKETDLRSQIEFCLSDRNLAGDRFFNDKIKQADGGWLDIEILKGFPPIFLLGVKSHQPILDALASSKLIDQKVTSDGASAFVRRGKGVRTTIQVVAPKRKAEDDLQDDAKVRGLMEKVDEAPPPVVQQPVMSNDPNLCYEFKKGMCFKGPACPWSHGIGPELTGGPKYRQGTRVVVDGLQAKAAQKFNGRVGECEEYDGATERWQVRLGDGYKLKVKEDNLRRC